MKDNEEFNFVQEKVKSVRKRKIKRALEVIGLSVIAALVFGLVSRVVFVTSGKYIDKALGADTETTATTEKTPTIDRQEVEIKVSPTKTTPTPMPTPTADLIEKIDTDTVEVVPTDIPMPPTEEPQVTLQIENGETSGDNGTEIVDQEIEDTEKNQTSDETINPLVGYMTIMSELKKLTGNLCKSLVRVEAITSGINWLDENIETTLNTSGAIVAQNGVELLMLAQYDKLVSADRIQVVFCDGTVADGNIYSKDSDLNLAIVGVNLQNIEENTLKEINYITFSDTDKLFEGEPIIALGRPNSIYGSVMYGFVTSRDIVAYVPDGVVSLFTTDMNYSPDSDGFILDFAGNLVGLLTHSIGNTDETGVCTVLGINSIEDTLVKLLNGTLIPYLGIRAEDIPDDVLLSMGITNGIYVNEVNPDEGASRAGIRKGDVIMSINDADINSVIDFEEFIQSSYPGKVATVKIYRSSQRDDPYLTVNARIGNK